MKHGFSFSRARPVAQHSCPACMRVFRGPAGVRTRLFHRIACRAHRVARIRIGLTEGGNNYTHAQNGRGHYRCPSNSRFHGNPATPKKTFALLVFLSRFEGGFPSLLILLTFKRQRGTQAEDDSGDQRHDRAVLARQPVDRSVDGSADSSHVSPLYRDTPNRNGKVHTNLVRPCLSQIGGWSSRTRSKTSGRTAVGLDQMRTRFLFRSDSSTLHAVCGRTHGSIVHLVLSRTESAFGKPRQRVTISRLFSEVNITNAIARHWSPPHDSGRLAAHPGQIDSLQATRLILYPSLRAAMTWCRGRGVARS
jgi:hypothetical protein